MIHTYKDKNGKTRFEVRVSKKSRKKNIRVHRRKRGFLSQGEAKRASKLLVDECYEELFERENSCASLGALLPLWSLALEKGEGGAVRHLAKHTGWDYVGTLNKWAVSLKNKPADKITNTEIRILLNYMEKSGRSAARRKTLVSALKALYRWSMIEGFLPHDTVIPVEGIKIDMREKSKPGVWTAKELNYFLASAKKYGHPWEPVWRGALYTGGRSGELYALEWGDINWENRQLVFQRSYSRKLKTIKSTKTGRWRTVPINTGLFEVLKELRVKNRGSKYVFPRFAEWERGDSARVLRMFCEGIGVTSINFHALRACFATQLIRNGVPPAVVMKICGWSELKTMQRYVRLAGIEIEGATDCLNYFEQELEMG